MRRWYEDFFYGMAQEFWNNVVPREQTRREAKFVEELAGLKRGDCLLDLLCGRGRLAIPLARKGYRIIGIDLSKESIAELKGEATKYKLPIEAREGDILELNLAGSFDGAICFGNSFAYFDHDEMALFLEKVSGCLRRGAKFLIHSGMFAESLLPNFEESDTMIAGDITLLLRHRYSVHKSSVQTRYVFKRKDDVEEKASVHWVYTLGEIKRLLRASGFEIAGLYRSTDKTRYRVRDAEAYLVVEKGSGR